MNRHQRRAAAAKSRTRIPKQRKGPTMMLSRNSPIPTDIKMDIAKCVRATYWPGQQQDCAARAMIGAWVLATLGFRATMTMGSLLYRAGDDCSRDVVSFHGPNNTGAVDKRGNFCGHVWLELAGEIIDFTSGDWGKIKCGDADCEPVEFGDIKWKAQPPEFIWANKSLFDWHPVGAPLLGECWYGPFTGEPPVIETDDIVDAITEMAAGMQANLERFDLFERCRLLQEQLIADADADANMREAA